MHHITGHVAVNQPVGFAASEAVSTDADLKHPPMTGTKTPSNNNNASTASDMTRPTISDKTKRQLIDAVSKNRLTIVIGPTGCGKSTQVPAILLDGLASPDQYILCTQPRRLAVCAVAERVAEERNVKLGGTEVGFHIGQKNLSSKKTRLLFTTAGILLEELRNNGMDALTKFATIIIDECHERSSESDLVLAICKSFMRAHPTAPIRIILMSATFDHARYASYFADVPGCESIESITLETASSFTAMYDRVRIRYIEDTIPLLPDRQDYGQLLRTMRSNPDADLAGDDAGKSLSSPMLRLIKSLLLWLDVNESEEGIFLLFAPTYRHLEQIFDIMRHCGGARSPTFSLGVLHSSVDVDECIREMKGKHLQFGGRRKLLLASAIADSSVTIPGVTAVVDLCRGLEVKWDNSRKNPIARTCWASQSVCDQRKGRTGRTCPGTVFRLVHRGHFVNLQRYETPALTLSSCRNEVLSLLCSTNKVMNERPSGLLSRCLDAPMPPVVTSSMEYLVQIGAARLEGKGKRRRLLPSNTGELLAALPFAVADSSVILAGSQLGLLHEILAFKAICSHKPAPIVHHFGNSARNETTLQSFYPDVDIQDPNSVALANFSAYIFWDTNWSAKRAKSVRKKFEAESIDFQGDVLGNGVGAESLWHWTDELEQEHYEWCRSHDINPTAVKAIEEILHVVMNILFHSHFEPDWLRCSSPTPRWRHKSLWNGEQYGDDDLDALRWVYGAKRSHALGEALASLSSEGGLSSLAIQRALVDMAGDRPTTRSAAAFIRKKKERPVACVFFLSGHCQFGSRCKNSHSPDAVPPPCRFYPTCTNDRCVYSHGDATEDTTAVARSLVKNPLEAIADASAISNMEPVEWYLLNESKLLLLGEGDFAFTRALRSLNLRNFVSTTYEGTPYTNDISFLKNVDATRLHLDARILSSVRTRAVSAFSWCFPFITGREEDEAGHEALILGTFHSLTALCKERPSREGFSLALALQGDQFSRWNVLRSACRAGWELVCFSNFDTSDFIDYQPCRANGEPFPLDKVRFYVFSHRRGNIA